MSLQLQGGGRRAHPFVWVDAFTETPFEGNPCAVVFDADDVSEVTRVTVARETRLSECAFLQRSDAADFGVRYYTAAGEIPFAGHPTVATVTALRHRGVIDAPSRFSLEVGAAVIAIEVDKAGEVTLTSPPPVFGRIWPRADIAPLLRLDPSDLAADPQTVSTGTPFCVTLLSSSDALARARLDLDAFASFAARPECDFGEPFLVSLGGATSAGDVSQRLFLAPPEPPEDPFTGSASTCAAAWLWVRGWMRSRHYVAEQGGHMGRPSRGRLSCVGPLTAPAAVRLSGAGVAVLAGEIWL